MSKPTGLLVFDRDNTLVKNIRVGSTISDYGGVDLTVETATDDIIGNIQNCVWVVNNGLQFRFGQTDVVSISTSIPNFNLGNSTLMGVLEWTGEDLNGGTLIATDSSYTGIKSFILDSSMDKMKVCDFVYDCPGATGIEIPFVIRSNGPSVNNIFSTSVWFGASGTEQNQNNFNNTDGFTSISNLYLGKSPATTFIADFLLKMFCFMDYEMTNTETEAFLSAPWQTVKAGGAPPAAKQNALFLGQDF